MSHTETPVRAPAPSLPTLIAISCLSAALALSAAWWFLAGRTDPSARRETISPEQMVSGTPNADVEVNGLAEVGREAPSATFTYLDGTTGSLSTFAGTTTLVNFWSSTCAPCLAEMPALEKVADDSGGSVVVVGVDVADSVDAGTKTVERTGVTYPIVRDPKGEILAAFGGRQLPHSVLIAEDGTVKAIVEGALDEQGIRDLVGS
ncbi:MAG: TlpA family protein disulfide reductase [Microthrixaceae bacterium]|nr:TlpA family protein disulfide reductase [Microthrixaceae bacterium]